MEEKKKGMRGKKFTRNLDSEKIKFKKPVLEKINIYFNNMQIILENIRYRKIINS